MGVRRARLAAIVAALLFVAPIGAQGWKPAALASFDDVWSTINETYFDPAFGGVDWKGVRDELRPKAEAAASPDDVRRVIVDMLGRLHRSHFSLLPSSGATAMTMGEASVPIDIRIQDRGVVITHSSAPNLKAGMYLVSIDEHIIQDWIRALPVAAGERARHFELWRQVSRALHGSVGSTARVSVGGGDGGFEEMVSVRRVTETGEVVTIGNLPPLHVRTDVRELKTPGGRTVGLLGFNVWLTQVNKAIVDGIDRFRGADGLIIDLRGNPGGLAAMIQRLAGQFIDDDTAVLGTMRLRANPTMTFKAVPQRATDDGRRVTPFAGPVAILVDELSASASECFAAGVQSLGRARVFGRTTMGAALPALLKKLPNGDVLEYAVGDFVTGKGRTVEGEGVVPDEIVPLTVEALLAGKDPDVEAALKWMDRQKGRVSARLW